MLIAPSKYRSGSGGRFHFQHLQCTVDTGIFGLVELGLTTCSSPPSSTVNLVDFLEGPLAGNMTKTLSGSLGRGESGGRGRRKKAP